MDFLFRNPFIASGFILLFFGFVSYTAYTGGELTSSSRGKANALESIMFWLTDSFGRIPTTIFFALVAVVGAYLVFKRVSASSEETDR